MIISKFKIKPSAFIALLTLVLCSSLFLSSGRARADTLGEARPFFTNQGYDAFSRTNINATLKFVSAHAYFYADNSFLINLSQNRMSFFDSSLNNLASEFENRIYPKETSFWGSEPDVDGDGKIVVLLENLNAGTGGYVDTINEYPKGQNAGSNGRDIVVINIQSVGNNYAKIFLAHEFQHLIDFNQKVNKFNMPEETWLNELRSEYSSTAVGYDDDFPNSNLIRRLATFTSSPSDSLTEWPNSVNDYGVADVFAEYLSEQYGSEILSESLRSPYFGIDSINRFLASHNYKEIFSDVFENFTLANYINNINIDPRYGYKNPNLFSIHVSPQQAYISDGNSDYTVDLQIKPWQSNWYQFNISNLTPSRAIKINFQSADNGFRVKYIDNLNRVRVLKNSDFITYTEGLKYFILMPIYEAKVTNFLAQEPTNNLAIDIGFVDKSQAASAQLKDGDLINLMGENDYYVVEGKYKRYLNPNVIKLYGQLDPAESAEIDRATFNSYITSNYVREVDDKKIYAVWSDGTKHWLNMTAKYFSDSGRDWGAVFIINQSEFDAYKSGKDITT